MTEPTPSPITAPLPAASPPAAPLVGASRIQLPTDPTSAAQQMADLIADPKFMERVAAKDASAFELYNKLWRLSRGLPVEPQPPQTRAEIENEADARFAAVLEQHAGVYRDRGYSDLQQIEIVGQRPILADEKRWHETQYNMKRNSPAFMARWTAGDLEAIREMQNHAIAMRLPTGTLDDIKRWEGA